MTSEKQIAANRLNAQKSTGPRTEAGKARSSLNAVKHGFSSRRVLLEAEDKAEFEAFRDTLISEFDPKDNIERSYAERFVAAAWRLERIQKSESLHLDRQMQILARCGHTPDPGDGYARISPVFKENERKLELSLDKALEVFHRHRARKMEKSSRKPENQARAQAGEKGRFQDNEPN